MASGSAPMMTRHIAHPLQHIGMTTKKSGRYGQGQSPKRDLQDTPHQHHSRHYQRDYYSGHYNDEKDHAYHQASTSGSLSRPYDCSHSRSPYHSRSLSPMHACSRWHKEYSELHDSILSCTGFVITYCNCPITWCSKLQTEIALSTAESECIALSSATCELLPLRRILTDILTHSFISFSSSHHTQPSTLAPSKIFEDNNACIILVTTKTHFKPRTKPISLNYHHFHDHIRNGNLQVLKSQPITIG